MAFFFPRTVYHIQRPQSYNPLAQLFAEFEGSNANGCTRRNRGHCQPQATYRHTIRSWEPRFDLRETEDSYLLFGELPGLNKNHVSVEFPEPRKLVVSAKFDTREEQTTAPEEQQEQTQQPAEDDAVSTVSDHVSETKSVSSYQATVEDDVEGDDFEVVSHSSKNDQEPKEHPLSEKQQEKQPERPATETPESQNLQHRSGEFARYFKFPVDIEQDQATAELKDGLLTVVVPKLKQAEPHRIVIQ